MCSLRTTKGLNWSRLSKYITIEVLDNIKEEIKQKYDQGN